MPDDVTDFVIVAESSYPPPPNPTFMIKLLQTLVRGYPDRLKILYSAPVSSIVQFVMNLLLPLMPGRLASKVDDHGVTIGSSRRQLYVGDCQRNGQVWHNDYRDDRYDRSVTHRRGRGVDAHRRSDSHLAFDDELDRKTTRNKNRPDWPGPPARK